MKIQDYIMLMLMIMKEFNQNEFKMKCQVFIEQLTKLVEEAEINKQTDEQYYLDFEDNLNLLSVKDHSLTL